MPSGTRGVPNTMGRPQAHPATSRGATPGGRSTARRRRRICPGQTSPNAYDLDSGRAAEPSRPARRRVAEERRQYEHPTRPSIEETGRPRTDDGGNHRRGAPAVDTGTTYAEDAGIRLARRAGTRCGRSVRSSTPAPLRPGSATERRHHSPHGSCSGWVPDAPRRCSLPSRRHRVGAPGRGLRPERTTKATVPTHAWARWPTHVIDEYGGSTCDGYERATTANATCRVQGASRTRWRRHLLPRGPGRLARSGAVRRRAGGGRRGKARASPIGGAAGGTGAAARACLASSPPASAPPATGRGRGRASWLREHGPRSPARPRLLERRHPAPQDRPGRGAGLGAGHRGVLALAVVPRALGGAAGRPRDGLPDVLPRPAAGGRRSRRRPAGLGRRQRARARHRLGGGRHRTRPRDRRTPLVRRGGDHGRGDGDGGADDRLLERRLDAAGPAGRHRHRHRGGPAGQRRRLATAAPSYGDHGDEPHRRRHRRAARRHGRAVGRRLRRR